MFLPIRQAHHHAIWPLLMYMLMQHATWLLKWTVLSATLTVVSGEKAMHNGPTRRVSCLIDSQPHKLGRHWYYPKYHQPQKTLTPIAS
jgi:hypothetical protein